MKKIKILGLFLCLFLTAAVLIPRSVLAGSAVMFLAPGSGNATPGAILAVQIKENSGTEKVNAIQANVSYPNSMLDFVGVDNSTTFSVVAQTENKGGTLKIARGTIPPSVTGVQTVATAKFKVRKDNGTINIQFAAGSMVVRDDGKGTNILSGTTGGSYAIGVAAASASSSTSLSNSAPPTPTADTVTVNGQTTSTATTQPITSPQDKPLVLKGVTIPNGIVNLYVYSEPKKYTTVADKDGNWSYTVIGLEPGQHKVDIEVTDPITQKTSPRKRILDFTVKPALAAQAVLNKGKTVSRWYALAGLPVVFVAGAGSYWIIHTRRHPAHKQIPAPPSPTIAPNP